MTDATFEDGAEKPLHLKAEDAESVPILSALVQDAVLTMSDMKWEPRARRLALLVNRFRWEDRDAAEKRGRAFERTRSLFMVGGVLTVASTGIDRADKETVLSVLALTWAPGEDGAGTLAVTLAGDGAIEARCECLDLTLRDVTRPYRALSGHVPKHPE
jgi:Protein of unknown function (DUF2948)